MRKNFLNFVAIAALAPVALAQAQQTADPAAPTPASAKEALKGAAVAREASFLKITIDPSRSPIAMDTEAGVSAEIKNVSAVPVKMYETETVFTAMPETRIYGETQKLNPGCATFPTQGNGGPRPTRGYDMVIQPGDSYRVFWVMTTNGCTGKREDKLRFWTQPLTWLEEKWQRVMFAPGTYKVYLNVVFYPQDQQPYHTATEGHDVLVSASQQMVLLGAFLGGLLAYLVKLYYGVETQLSVNMPDSPYKTIIQNTEWLVAGTFGAAMVILASRLSDTFPVKVNANDFWGSMTLGFVFQWIGVKLLEKLPGMGPASTPAANNPPAPPQAPVIAAAPAQAQTAKAAVDPVQAVEISAAPPLATTPKVD